MSTLHSRSVVLILCAECSVPGRFSRARIKGSCHHSSTSTSSSPSLPHFFNHLIYSIASQIPWISPQEEMSGFGDDEKLRAARELAQSFSKSKPAKKKNVSGGSYGYGSRPVIHVPQYHQPAPLIRQPPVTRPAIQNIPPPSQRNYSATASFSTGRAGKSVIGTSGLDFLKASGAKARDTAQPQPSTVSIASEVTSTIKQIGKISTIKQTENISTTKQTEEISTIKQIEKMTTINQTENINNGTSTNARLPTIPPQASENAPFGNILDAFLSIVAKKPSLGQEIDTLTQILPKALDLNATESTPSAAPPTNGHSVGDTAANDNHVLQGSSVGASQNRTSDHSLPNKISPVATAVAPTSGKAKGQTVGTNGVSKVSVTVTKGLSASSWA
ncbi:hypothetical protein THAR02_03369 [Trichoderma harzianum]|uniref:Uncharacterized protein n=1 Tax=Trichoderma harzianum TaxID=5544 RepID=A0A0F9XWZ3_TRIHA|nr:hypothetical protein THAR02_03369 [Trichoderma harzianum]